MPTDLTITRFAYSELGTFGRFFVDGQVLYTVERPWLNNIQVQSCIPEGVYQCSPQFYNRGGYAAVEIKDVPGRTHILFHKGNTMNDVAGCVVVVSRLGVCKSTWGGLDSANAFRLFMKHYGGRDFELEITHDDTLGRL